MLSEDDEFVRSELGDAARRLFEARLPLDVLAEQSDNGSADLGLWEEMHGLGWVEAALDPGGLVTCSNLLEECGRALYRGPLFSSGFLAAECLPPTDRIALLDDRRTFTMAWMELSGMRGLRDASSVQAIAHRSGDQWQVTGVKTAVPDADMADEAVVVAATDEGPCLLGVPLHDSMLSPLFGLDPTRREFSVTLAAADARLLHGADTALDVLRRARNSALIAVAWEALGLAARALELIVAHACGRAQFGRAIGSFQAVANPLADAYVDIQLARSLTLWAAIAVRGGESDADLAAEAAKWSAAKAAVRTCERAIQVAGAIGFSWEFALHRFLRRALWIESFEEHGNVALQGVAHRLIDERSDPRTVELFDDPAAATFRFQVRDWVQQSLPTQARGLELISSMEEFDQRRQEWRVLMRETGGLTAHWPTEFGGQGASDVITAVFREEAIRAHPRVSHGDCGVDLVAPLLMRYGTEQQKARFLQSIKDERGIWTQGFSEPNAGSDLASLTTRATWDGASWIVNGTKTWSTYAPVADWIFVLARTDPQANRHRGISCLLVDARSPGVEVRPIRDIAGGLEFAEIFFTDVRVPEENLLGEVNDGWSVAVMTLAHERVIESYEDIGELGFVIDRLLDGLRDHVARHGAGSIDASIRQSFAEIWCRYQAVRLVQYACVLALEGTNAPPSESEIVKLVWSETAQDAARLGLTLFGSAEFGGQVDFWRWNYFNARSLTIYAGTSEIIRSVVAERVLGLPRSR